MTKSSFSFGSPKTSKKLQTCHLTAQDKSAADAENPDAMALPKGPSDQQIEGFLVFRKRARRRRYCILQGQTMLVFKSKPANSTSPGTPHKRIGMTGMKDAMELETSVRIALLGNGAPGSFDNTLVISSHKSKCVVVEAGTRMEKDRWLNAMTTIHSIGEESRNEDALSQSSLLAQTFDAHTAVTLLHKHRTNAMATELVLDRFASYAEQNVDDVEFYIQQIVHLTVNANLAATDKLVNLLLSICRAKAYVEHLGNCIHLALQLFWLLEAKIADEDSKTYNLCAKLLMSIEAKVVNQQFELPSTQTADDVNQRLMHIPHMKEKLEQMMVDKHKEVLDKEELLRAAECLTPIDQKVVSPPVILDEADTAQKPALLLQWMEKERLKRYKYFHHQRHFVKALTDISERMRAIDPPQNRKKHLPEELKALIIPDMAYVPLGRVSDPFCRITRVLTEEGTVFSTHSRAPCLLCFEVIEDQVNFAGQHRLLTKSKELDKSLCGSTCDLTPVVAELVKKFAINGHLLCIEESSAPDEDESEVVEGGHQDRKLSAFATQERQSVLDSPSSPVTSDDFMNSTSKLSGENAQELSLIRDNSKTAYEMGLSKLLSVSEVFGESWQAKKDRIRASSPYGHLPGWNVVSLISKSNDDIRQEVFAMQLITTFQTVFQESGLPLWLRPYRIVSTGRSSGLLETITDAQSLDALKKGNGYVDLRAHFEKTYGVGDAFKKAQRNFLHSLAAYSVVCYLLQIKDRHNGNILLDTDGHLVHIDFGFMLGIAPGGNWSFETAPFKLTKEMVLVLGGVSSPLFGEFVQLVALGLLAAQRHAQKVVTLVEIMMHNSTFPCFQGRDVSRDLQKLQNRFLLQCSTEETVKAVVKMIRTSYKNKWTRRYDQFQKITNGIVP